MSKDQFIYVPTNRKGNLIKSPDELMEARESLLSLISQAAPEIACELLPKLTKHEVEHGMEDIHLSDLGGRLGVIPDPKCPCACYKPEGPRTVWEIFRILLGPYREEEGDFSPGCLITDFVTDSFDAMAVCQLRDKLIFKNPDLSERYRREPLGMIVDEMVELGHIHPELFPEDQRCKVALKLV